MSPRTLHPFRLARRSAIALAVAAWAATPSLAHELWIETDAKAPVGEPHRIEVCWGHSGDRESREMLQQQQRKLSARAVRPDGTQHALRLTLGNDSFTANLAPEAPGCHVVGAELQAGIIDEEFHGIPANARIVMVGKSVAHAGGSEGFANALGFDLEIVPVTDPATLRSGDVVTVKLLLRGKPIGGRTVVVALGTAGPKGPADDPRIQSSQWSIEAHPDPRTGEVSFPLIVGGRHVFSIRYLDETPGVYEGDLDEASSFSHLRKGDRFERSMYMSTLSVSVEPR